MTDKEYLTPEEVVLCYQGKITVRTLANWRSSGVAHFSPRDLRRTWKTLAGEAGLSKERRDLIQHHTKCDVSSKHYDRYEHLREKRESMQQWSEWFRDKIESPS